MITGSLPLNAGVPYRLNELADLIDRTRPTVERYAKRFSFEFTTVEYKGKQVAAVVLTPENIEQIATLLQQGDDGDRDPVTTSLEPDVTTRSQQDHDPWQGDYNSTNVVLSAKLEAAQEKIDSLNAKLIEQKTLYERLVSAKDNEISTLKTSMVMMEKLKRYGALDATPSKPGPLARLGQWLSGLAKPSQPAASYQQIDPLVEQVNNAVPVDH